MTDTQILDPPRTSSPAESKSRPHRFGLELAGVGLVLTAMAFAVFGWYAFHGGFVADDWVNADKYYFHPEPGFWGAVDNYQTPSRPVAAVWVTLTYAVLGTDFAAHLVLSVLLAAFLSIAFFAFLRTLGLELTLALAAAALLLVFPMSDSTRLWSTGSQINLFIGLYLVAATIAIVGRRRFGPGPSVPAVLTQVLASALAVTAVAGYEIVAPAVLLSVFLYRWAGGRGGEVWRWLLDAIPTALLLLLYTRKFGESASGEQLLSNVRIVAEGASYVFGYTFHPSRTMSRWTGLLGVLGILLVIVLVRRIAIPSPDRDSIVRWLKPMLLALVAVVIGYLMLIPAADRYPIYAPGVQNRTNCFAALGLSALMVFVLGAVASMLVAAAPRISEATRRWLRPAVAGLLIFAMIGVYTVRISEDADRWVAAATIQNGIIDEAHVLVPSPPNDATIFTSPYPGNIAAGVPIFAGGGNNDQVGAFKVSYDADEMRSFPMLGLTGVICGPTSMWTPDAGNSETEYGKAILADFRDDVVYRPRNRRECIRYKEAMFPYGPVNLTDEW